MDLGSIRRIHRVAAALAIAAAGVAGLIAAPSAMTLGPTGEKIQAPKAPSVEIEVKGINLTRPSLKLSATAGSSELRQVRLKLPASLSFEGRGAFAKGVLAKADGRKLGRAQLGNRARKLRVTVQRGAETVVVRVAKGALRNIDVAERRLPFSVELLDADGTRTALEVLVEAT